MPFPPFPENEMNNQAAQTMPLPEPYMKGRKEIPGRGKWDIDCGAGPDLYTAEQMHQYARDYAAALSQTAGVAEDHVAIPRHYAENVGYAATMLENSASVIDRHNAPALRNLMALMLAAAPAASGGEHSPGGDIGVGSPEQTEQYRRENPPVAASVSERARELLAGVYRDSGYLYEADTLEAGVVDSIDDCALRAIEKALTKPTLPSVKVFASAVWRDWMTNEQADKLGAELHAWLGAHVAALEQALTQQRGECEVVAWCALTQSGSIAYFDGRPMLMVGKVGNEHHPVALYTAPQPSAEGLRELVQRWRATADRYDNEPIGEGDDPTGHKALALESCADELESLLARGGHG